jgi:glutathione S-transferase
MRSPEHLAKHPFGRIPILEHGDFTLYETQAILRYIDRILPQPPLTPVDPKAAGRMDQLMNVSDWYVFQGVGNVIGFQRVVGPKLMGLTPDEAAIETVMPRAKMVFGELAKALGDQPYFAGDQFTLADVILSPQVDFFAQCPEWEALAGPHANLGRWLARVGERPSLKATTWERLDTLAQAA